MMAWRTLGRLGDGGGPGLRVHLFFPPRRVVPGKAQVLQKGISDARHERVPVQPCSGATLEVTQAQLPLELLVRLLAHPARLDGSRQRAQ